MLYLKPPPSQPGATIGGIDGPSRKLLGSGPRECAVRVSLAVGAVFVGPAWSDRAGTAGDSTREKSVRKTPKIPRGL